MRSKGKNQARIFLLVLGILVLVGLVVWGTYQFKVQSSKFKVTVGNSKLGNEETEIRPTRFAVLSDVHSDTENLRKALDKINMDNIDLAIITGDLTTVGKLSELQDIHQVLAEKTRRFYVIPGNHDNWTGNRVGVDYFSQVFGERYRSFKVSEGVEVSEVSEGESTIENQNSKIENENDNLKIKNERENIRLILIDNSDWRGIETEGAEESKVSKVSEGENQWEWIERETEECPRIICLVFMHMPLNHPSSKHIMGEDSLATASQAAELRKLLVKNKVRQVFAGHLHYASSYTIDGLKTQIVGSLAEERNWQSPRYLQVDINKNDVRVEEIYIE